MRRKGKTETPKISVIGLPEQREGRGWSHHDLAEELGTNRSYIAYLEGGNKPSVETLLDLARLLGRVMVTDGTRQYLVIEVPGSPGAKGSTPGQRPPELL